MGYNTAVLILNDAMDGLHTDPNAGRKMYDAIADSQQSIYSDKGKSFPIGGYANGGMVLPSQHADQVQIIAVGGNNMIPMGTIWGGWRVMGDTVELTKRLADSLGYRLVKKASR